jgi:hypothetical protein
MEDRRKQQSRERAARYYQKYKDKVLERNRKEVNCKYCGRLINYGGLWKHYRTDVCKQAFEYLKNNYNINPDKENDYKDNNENRKEIRDSRKGQNFKDTVIEEELGKLSQPVDVDKTIFE